jgi:hypothetical protein
VPAQREPDLQARTVARLRDCLRILDRQREAIIAGRTRHVAELGRLESQATREIESLGRVLAAREGRMPGPPGNAVLRAERARLCTEVLERNRRNRDLMAGQLLEVRRQVVALRLRVGVPSPYATLGEASLVDLTT